jgi:hypothetical protein
VFIVAQRLDRREHLVPLCGSQRAAAAAYPCLAAEKMLTLSDSAQRVAFDFDLRATVDID